MLWRTSTAFLGRGGMVLAQLFRSSSLHRLEFTGDIPYTHSNRLSHQLAAKLKLNAPYAHTWLEIVHVRWGRTAHLVFMFFGFVVITLQQLGNYH